MNNTYTLQDFFDTYKKCPFCQADANLTSWIWRGQPMSIQTLNLSSINGTYLGTIQPIDYDRFISIKFPNFAENILLQIYCECFAIETTPISTKDLTPFTPISFYKKTNYLVDQNTHYAVVVNYKEKHTLFSRVKYLPDVDPFSSGPSYEENTFDDAAINSILELDFTKPQEVLHKINKIFLLK